MLAYNPFKCQHKTFQFPILTIIFNAATTTHRATQKQYKIISTEHGNHGLPEVLERHFYMIGGNIITDNIIKGKGCCTDRRICTNFRLCGGNYYYNNNNNYYYYYYYYYYYTIWMSVVTGISSRYFSWTSSDPHRSLFKLHTAVLSVLCVMFRV